MQEGFYIGTSGWMYKDWHEAFYPKELKKDLLPYYSGHFNTVEVNSSFYHLPPVSTFKKWYGEVPEDFLFSVKLSRYITHQLRLQDTKEPLRNFLRNARELKEKLGPVLVQLPPSFKRDEKLLAAFFKDMRAAAKRLKMPDLRIAFEPRHPGWFDGGGAEKTLPVLREYNIAAVFAHSSRWIAYEAEAQNITADFVYVRFHGPEQFAASEYGAAGLRPWVKTFKRWMKEKRTVFAYFNNDVHGYAIKDVKRLIRTLER